MRTERKVFRLVLKDDRVEQCLRSCGSEFHIVGVSACGCQKCTRRSLDT